MNSEIENFLSSLTGEISKTNALIGEIYADIKRQREESAENEKSRNEVIKYNSLDFDTSGSFKFFKIYSNFILKAIKTGDASLSVDDRSVTNASGRSRLSISDFIGIDDILKHVFQNTIKFASGKPANNVLLWGDRGTGKSSLIRSIAESFNEEPYKRKIKFIEVVEDTAEAVYELISILKERPFRFVLIFDDIAFDADSLIYKKLKSILDGGLDELPENVIIYATSNKRHLTTENFVNGGPGNGGGNNIGGFIHPEEEAQEGLSLSDRFGLSYGFYSFDKETYLRIVELYLKKYDIKISSLNLDITKKEALNFAAYKGSRSGRTAKQFAVSLIKDI